MQTKHRSIDASDLGIELASKKESQIFRWFLACLLFGKPIQQDIARRAFDVLVSSGIGSINELADADWQELVTLLDEAHYARYDFSTATKLLQIAKVVKDRYESVTQLVETAGGLKELENRLTDIKGIGPVTASIFLREVGPVWFGIASSHDFDAAMWAAQVLVGQGFDTYIIGGAVRDLYLGRDPKDFDLTTNATPDEIMQITAFERSKYKDAAQAYGVTRIKFTYDSHTVELEVATFRKDLEAHKGRKSTKIAFADLEDDIDRRDFTINALAFDPSTSQIIDFVGGLDDLDDKQIRFIGDSADRIREDPLRIMRAIRFKSHLGFAYAKETSQAIKKSVKQGDIENIAVDRLRDELTRLLVHPTRKQAMIELHEFGILERVLPEVTAGIGVKQPPEYHAEGDVWQHELTILNDLPAHPNKRLAWAALLHDIGKGPTFSGPRAADDRIHFDRHYAVGAEMARTILRRLRFSTSDADDIFWMIYNHMAIDDLPDMRPSRQQEMLGNPAFEDLLELHRADAAASWRPGQSHDRKPAFRKIDHIWHEYQLKSPELQQPSLKKDLGIDGVWLNKTFGNEFDLSGEAFGKVLHALNDWYRDEGEKDVLLYVTKARQLLLKFAKKK